MTALLEKFIPGIDTPEWKQLKPVAVSNVAGVTFCTDKRNSIFAENASYSVNSTGNLYKQSEWYNGFQLLTSSLALPAFGAGTFSVICPAFGVYGNIGAGCTTEKIVTSTANTMGSSLSALGPNQLIRTDLLRTYQIKITGKTSGKTEHRIINGNTASATPVIYLDVPLSFTPAAGDTFEITSGQVQTVCPTTTQAGQMRYYSIASGQLGNSGATGITTGAATVIIALDETFVPNDMRYGEGLVYGNGSYDTTYEYKRAIIATASGASSITGPSSGYAATLASNEFRNYQIRIVEDISAPTANGQRNMIASHTGGASPVFTMGTAWAVQPSANAKFVIENPNVLLMQNSTQAGMLTYNFSPYTINNGTASITAFTWSTTMFNATHGAAIGAGAMFFPSWGYQPEIQTDGTKIVRQSYCYLFRGGASTTLDRFDIAGGVNGAWSDNINYNNPISFGTGSSGDFDPVCWRGGYSYIVQNITQQMYQFNCFAPSLTPWVALPAQSATAAVQSQRVFCSSSISEKISGYNYDTLAYTDSIPVDDYLGKVSSVNVNSNAVTTLHKSDIIV